MKKKSIGIIRNIIPKHHSIFNETFTNFFSNAGKTENMTEFRFDIF